MSLAVATVDTIGGIILAVAAGLWLVIDGIRDRARDATPPRVSQGAAGLPSTPARRSVEAGPIAAAGAPYRKGEAGRSSRVSPAAAANAIEALTFPGPYSRCGVKR